MWRDVEAAIGRFPASHVVQSLALTAADATHALSDLTSHVDIRRDAEQLKCVLTRIQDLICGRRTPCQGGGGVNSSHLNVGLRVQGLGGRWVTSSHGRWQLCELSARTRACWVSGRGGRSWI